MRKDILLSLLAAGAIPTAAFADIDVTSNADLNNGSADSWKSGATLGVYRDGETLSDNTVFNGLFYVEGVGVNEVTKTVAADVLPKGTYKLTIDGDNCKCTVSGDGVVQDGNSFTYNGTGTITFAVSRKAAGDFAVRSLTLKIDITFSQIKTNLETLPLVVKDENDDVVATYTLSSEPASTTSLEDYLVLGTTETDLAHAYKKDGDASLTAVNEKRTAITEKLNALVGVDDKSDADQLAFYKETTNWDLEESVMEVLNAIKAHNEKVEELTNKQQNYAVNYSNASDLLEDVKVHKATVDGYTVGEGITVSREEFDTAYNDFVSSLSALLVDNEVVEVAEEYNTALTNLGTLASNYCTAVDDATVVAAIEGYKTQIDDACKPVFNYIMGLTGKYNGKKTAELTDIKETAKANLDALKVAENPSAGITITENNVETTYSASDYTAHVLTAISNLMHSISDVEGVDGATKDGEVVAAGKLKALHESALADQKALVDGTPAVPAVGTEGDPDYVAAVPARPGLTERISGLSDKNKLAEGLSTTQILSDIEAASAAIASAYEEYYTEEVDGKTAKAYVAGLISGITDAISNLTTDVIAAEDNQAIWEDVNKQLKEQTEAEKAEGKNLRTRLEEQKAALADASVDLGNGKKIDLAAAYAEVYTNADLAIKETIAANDAFMAGEVDEEDNPAPAVDSNTIKDIEKTVKLYEDKGGNTVKDFTAKWNEYTELSTSLNNFKGIINSQIIQELNEDGTVKSGNPLLKKTYTDKVEGETGYQAIVDGVKSAIEALEGKVGDDLYASIGAIDTKSTTKSAIDTDYEYFVAHLVTGNMAELKAKADAYNADFAAATEATYGPGLASLKALMDTEAAVPAVGTEGEEGYVPGKDEVKHYTAKVADLKAIVDAIAGATYPVEGGAKDATEAYKAQTSVVINLYNEMTAEVDALSERCKANVAAKAAIEAEGSELSKLKATISGLEKWVKDNDGDDNDKPAATFLASDDYKALSTTAIDEAITAAYNDNALTADTQKTEIEAMNGNITTFKNRVTTNANNYVAAKAQYANVYNEIKGKAAVPEVPAVGTEGEDGYVPAVPAQPAIESLEAWLDKATGTPALEAWKADKHETYKYTTIGTELDRIVNAIQTAFEEGKCNATTEGDKITALQTAVNDFKGAVTANETNHNTQLDNAGDAAKDIHNAIQTVENSGYSEDVTFTFSHDKNPLIVAEGKEDKEMTLAEVKTAIEEQQTGLAKLNKKVYDDYAALKSDTKNIYTEVVDTVNAYVHGIAGAYYAAVEQANLEAVEKYLTMKDAEGNPLLDNAGNPITYKDSLSHAYQDAVVLYNKISAKKQGDLYNNYVDLLLGDNWGYLDPGYYNLWVEPGYIDASYGHDHLQKHYEKIRELNRLIEELKASKLAEIKLSDEGEASLDGKDGVLTKEDFADFIDVNNEKSMAYALQEMNGYITNLTNAVNTYAKTCIEKLHDYEQRIITTAEGYMETAGLSDVQIAEATAVANRHILLATQYLTMGADADNLDENDPAFSVGEDVVSGDVDKYISNMNAFLNEITLVSVDTKGAISNYWTGIASDADALMTELQAAFDEDKENSQPEAFEEAQAKWDEAWNTIYDHEVEEWGYDRFLGYSSYMRSGIKTKATYYLDRYGISTVANNIGQFSRDLQDALDLAQEALNLSGIAAEQNAANMARIEVYKDSLVSVRADLATLHEKVGKLGLTLDEFKDLDQLQYADNAVETFAKALVIKDENGNVVLDDNGNTIDIKNAFDNREKINGLIDNAYLYIDAAYNQAYALEIKNLNRIHKDVLADFNNKYAEVGHETDELTEWDKAIKAQKALIDDAPNHGFELEEDEDGNVIAITPAQKLDALVAIEEALLNIQKEMNVSDSTNPDASEAAIAQLDSYATNNVESCINSLEYLINDLNDYLEQPEMDDYEVDGEIPSVTDLRDELQDIKDKYAADKSVETSYSYYEGLLNTLRTKVGYYDYFYNPETGSYVWDCIGLNKDVKKMLNEASSEYYTRHTSNNWASEMEAELAKVDAHYKAITDEIEGYSMLSDEFKAQLPDMMEALYGEVELDENDKFTLDEDGNVIGGLIAIEKAKVQIARKNYTLNDRNTSWNQEYSYEEERWVNVSVNNANNGLYDLDALYASIDNLALTAAQAEVSGWLAEATKEYNRAKTAVGKSYHLDQAELDEKLAALTAGYDAIDATFSELTEFARNKMTAESVLNDAKALAELADNTFFTPGDLDKSGKVTALDFTKLVEYILTESKPEDEVEFAAADLNRDEEISVGDAVLEMGIINRKEYDYNKFSAPRRGANECVASLEQGTLNLTNNFNVAAIMVDLKGVSESDISLSSRAAGMQLMTNTLPDGKVRAIVIATDDTMLSGNEGAILYVNGNASLVQAVAADARGAEYIAAKGEATAIDMIAGAVKSVGQKVYNVGGQMLNSLKKGINIIVGNDGSAKKVVK